MPYVAVAIVGGGVIGRAIALECTRRGISDVVVVERLPSDRVDNQSTRNSGVIHAGIYYKRQQRPLKARLCVSGNESLYQFCERYEVPHARCGKLLVALDDCEAEYLQDIWNTATENGVPDVRMIDGDEARSMEPNVTAHRALHVPTSGIVDAAYLLQRLRQLSSAHNLDGCTVERIDKHRDGFELTCTRGTQQETFVAHRVINAAGLYADDIARLFNPESTWKILSVRGESARFNKTLRTELNMRGMNIYPAPHGFDKKTGKRLHIRLAEFRDRLAREEIIDSVGVHLTPTLDADGRVSSTVTIGPALTMVSDREDYGDKLHSASRYHDGVSRFFPGLQLEDVELHQAGIMARLSDRIDWWMAADPNDDRFINLLGLDSPALTACLAIAEHVVTTLV
ncbi:MAG: Aminobutyraldehyde dehydrogenase [Myxococcales bacterium]|nr:Aminobutyraldehyde dehydrogenase [Myxococcales bacterium]